MAKKSEINLTELVAEARVARVLEEEQELETKDSKVRQLKEWTNNKLKEMAELAPEDIEARREIRNEVVVENLRLVTQVIKKYGYFSPDKFQNGCVGLLKAADTFDVSKGVPFSNYAAFCIETEIRLVFKKENRKFESKNKDYLESLDAPTSLGNGDQINKHETIQDEFSYQEFDAIVEEAEIDTLFYDIIIPAIEAYGTRAKDIDMELWKQLEIQYFIELSMEKSQRQRITFTEMARQLGSTPQNMRTRHKKVMALIRQGCIDHGYNYSVSENRKATFTQTDQWGQEVPVRYRGKKHKNR